MLKDNVEVDNNVETQRCDVTSGKCVPKQCQPDRYEPNNDFAHAFGVTASSYTGLTLCPGDVDDSSIAPTRGDQLGVNIDADPFSENNFSAVVKDASGRTLSVGKFLASYVATAAATYYVGVSTTDSYQPYDITFLLSRGTPCDDDAFEPNDTPAQATPLNTTREVDGQICPQDLDHFSVNVPASHGISATLSHYDPSQGLLVLCLFKGATQLACSDDLVPVVAAAAADVGGQTVILRVAGSADRIANGYTLEVSLP